MVMPSFEQLNQKYPGELLCPPGGVPCRSLASRRLLLG